MRKRMSGSRTSRSQKRQELPEIIPPRSVFRLKRTDEHVPTWKGEVGRVFRIGYYSKQDGLEVIWLVNEQGKYEQTTDHDFLVKYFEPIEVSDETDLYGTRKPPFKPL